MGLQWQNASSYKLAKELFVRDLEGSTIWEVLLLYLPLPVGLWLFGEIEAFHDSSGKPPLWGWRKCSLELALVVGPLLIASMPPVLSETSYLVTGAMVLCMGLAAFLLRSSAQRKADLTLRNDWRRSRTETLLPPVPRFDAQDQKGKSGGELAFIDQNRGWAMLGTVIAILAVDFQVFPRRFAKTEVYGTGLMDLGTSAFIFISGLCSSYARQAGTGKAPNAGGKRPASVAGALWLSLKKSWPLVVLGVSRFLTIKATDYQEHVTEYGVHWNFFLTLAMVKLVSVLVHSLFLKHFNVVVMAIFSVLAIYQISLLSWGMDEYIVNGPRDTLLSQNREGIFGVPGYLCIFFAGELTGQHLIWSVKGKSSKNILAQWKYTLNLLLIYGSGMWVLTLLCDRFMQQISRRFVNFPYVCWSIAMSLTSLALSLAVGIYSSGAVDSVVLMSLSKNMLIVFFLANILTGAVNLTMETLYVSNFIGILIVTLYTSTVCVSAMIYLRYSHSQAFKKYFSSQDKMPS